MFGNRSSRRHVQELGSRLYPGRRALTYIHIWLRADVSQEGEMMSRKDSVVGCVGVTHFTGSAGLRADLTPGGLNAKNPHWAKT